MGGKSIHVDKKSSGWQKELGRWPPRILMMHRPDHLIILKPLPLFAVAVLLSNCVTLASTSSVPSACLTPIANSTNSCEQALHSDIQVTVQYYTQKFAQQFSFCVDDPVRERNAAFDFSENMSFLATCLTQTEGTILDRICSGGEIKAYLESLINLIKSSGQGMASSPIENVNCNESKWSQGCEDGWSTSLQVSVAQIYDLYINTSFIPMRNDTSMLPCCGGFFCPRGLSCMIPCPLGAQCSKASFIGGLCSPYGYQVTPGRNYSCGGANRWADLSNSNGTFCPAGSYCPSTVEIHQCDTGYYCRQGSTVQSKCLQLISCNDKAPTQHIQAYGLMIIVGLATTLVLIYNCSERVMHIRENHKIRSREKAMQQVREHSNAVKRWKFAVQAMKQLKQSFSQNRSESLEEMQELAPSSMLFSNDVHSSFGTIHEERSDHGAARHSLPVIERNGESNADRLGEEEPSEVPPVNWTVTGGQRARITRPLTPQTASQIFRYAYAQIEKERELQNKSMNWNEVLLQAGQVQEDKKKRLKIEITFQDLSLSLKGSKKKILCNVNGKLSPGRVTAVMGPSGAGKTTFLNALAGKTYKSITTGLVLINGKPDPIKSYKKVIGFVPQDDIVHGNLTVEENLWFSAHYRLSMEMPKAEKVLVVERIIDALGLESIRNSKVGTVEKRGISGGQRKRVNVGLEMVMEPSLLILDEPTSGLDSTSSQLVLRALRREARVGVNVGVVLHQPSYTLFRMFDDVMFLAKGGRTVYFGPVDEVENYFSSMSIVVPERTNPPDHYMDILEGIRKPEGDPGFDPKLLPIKWIQYKGYSIPEDLQVTILDLDVPPENMNMRNGEGSVPTRISGRAKSVAEDMWEEFKIFLEVQWDDFKGTFSTSEDLSKRRTPGFWKQFTLILSRLALQRFREARLQIQDYLILLLTGACLGLLTPSKDSSLGSNNYTYVIIALSLLCMIAALRTFTNDKLQFWRESASGINKLAYFLAKDMVDHFTTVIKPVIFLSTFYFFNNPRSTFVENYIVTLSLVYCVVGLAYIFAITAESGPAQLWAVFLPIILTLIATHPSSSGPLKALQYATYARWALEAYVIANTRRYSGVWLISRCAMLYGLSYDLNNWALCLSMLFVMGFAARCVAVLCLMLCNRKRQQ